jgi:hypothetical protein
LLDDSPLRALGPPRDLFHRAPAKIARFKILAGINPGGITGQFAFRPADRFEKFRPRHLRQAPATIDQVCERRLLHCLTAMFLLDDFEERRA